MFKVRSAKCPSEAPSPLVTSDGKNLLTPPSALASSATTASGPKTMSRRAPAPSVTSTSFSP